LPMPVMLIDYSFCSVLLFRRSRQDF